MAADLNSTFIVEKLAAAERLMLEAQKEIFAAIEHLEESEGETTGVQRLFNSTGVLIRATTCEKILLHHYGKAPKTIEIARGIYN